MIPANKNDTANKSILKRRIWLQANKSTAVSVGLSVRVYVLLYLYVCLYSVETTSDVKTKFDMIWVFRYIVAIIVRRCNRDAENEREAKRAARCNFPIVLSCYEALHRPRGIVGDARLRPRLQVDRRSCKRLGRVAKTPAV